MKVSTIGNPLLMIIHSCYDFELESLIKKSIQFPKLLNYFPQMGTIPNKKKLEAFNRENQEEHPRNNMSRDTNAPRVNEEYIAQVSEKFEGGVTKNLPQEFS